MTVQTIFENVSQELAEQLDIKCKVHNHHAVFENEPPLSMHLELLDEKIAGVFIYFYVRTTSWDLPGERTDAHELISVLLAAFLRIELGFSCTLIDISNPAVEVPETEIYARYIVPTQPHNATYTLDEAGINALRSILDTVLYFKTLLPHLFDWSVEEREGQPIAIPTYDWLKATNWAGCVANALDEPWVDLDWPENFTELMTLVENGEIELEANEQIQFAFRTNPNWKHYRSVNTGISVYEASTIAAVLTERIQARPPWDLLEGVDAKLYLSGKTHNAILNEYYKLVSKALPILTSVKTSDVVCIPLA
jgi:hypothetical protein